MSFSWTWLAVGTLLAVGQWLYWNCDPVLIQSLGLFQFCIGLEFIQSNAVKNVLTDNWEADFLTKIFNLCSRILSNFPVKSRKTGLTLYVSGFGELSCDWLALPDVKWAESRPLRAAADGLQEVQGPRLCNTRWIVSVLQLSEHFGRDLSSIQFANFIWGIQLLKYSNWDVQLLKD